MFLLFLSTETVSAVRVSLVLSSARKLSTTPNWKLPFLFGRALQPRGQRETPLSNHPHTTPAILGHRSERTPEAVG